MMMIFKIVHIIIIIILVDTTIMAIVNMTTIAMMIMETNNILAKNVTKKQTVFFCLKQILFVLNVITKNKGC